MQLMREIAIFSAQGHFWAEVFSPTFSIELRSTMLEATPKSLSKMCYLQFYIVSHKKGVITDYHLCISNF